MIQIIELTYKYFIINIFIKLKETILMAKIENLDKIQNQSEKC